MTSATDTLMAMYGAMRERFGHRRWWPGDSPLEICIGAILTQNTNWGNVEKAIANLKAADVLNLDALKHIGVDRLSRLIRPAGYYNLKARRLKAFIAAANEAGSLEALLAMRVGPLRQTLLAVNGIGPETADSIILYAAGKARFVVDAYTKRIFSRHGLVEPDADYDDVQGFCEQHLPRRVSLYNDFHAQLVETAKQFCRPKNPRCPDCPLHAVGKCYL